VLRAALRAEHEINHGVMRGLDPRIHLNKTLSNGMDCQVKPGNEGEMEQTNR
jgi:hypothetical protein